MKISMKKMKIIGIVLLVILGAVLVIQNTQMARIQVFAWEVPLPRAVWFVLAVAIGFVLGMIVGSRVYEGDKREVTEDDRT